MFSRLRATFDELGDQVRGVLADPTPEVHQFFFDPLHISAADRLRFVTEMLAMCSHTVVAPVRGLSIPRVIHRIWLTNPAAPSLPSGEYLTRIASRMAKINGYRYLFWHNSERAAEMFAENLRHEAIEFRHIDLIPGNELLVDRIHAAIDQRKYVLAGDMTKYLVLNVFGGVYADMGVDFGQELLDLVETVDVSLFLDRNVFFQPAFMATPPRSAPFNTWCNLCLQPEALAALTLDKGMLSAGSEIWLHGGVGFTAALMLDYDSSYSVLPVPPNRGLLTHYSEGSWYRAGNKFGNVTLSEAPLTHIDRNHYASLAATAAELDEIAECLGLRGPALTRFKIDRLKQRRFWLC